MQFDPEADGCCRREQHLRTIAPCEPADAVLADGVAERRIPRRREVEEDERRQPQPGEGEG
jgi:hypothetical protein